MAVPRHHYRLTLRLAHLADLASGAAEDPPGLPARATDPRHRRGVRHRLPVILGLAAYAALAGARSPRSPSGLPTLTRTPCAGWGCRGGAVGVTFRRTLQRLDADVLDERAAGTVSSRRYGICVLPQPVKSLGGDAYEARMVTCLAQPSLLGHMGMSERSYIRSDDLLTICQRTKECIAARTWQLGRQHRR